MQGCAPSVAQALLPYPQFCDPMQSGNEYTGNFTFHSFQLKMEKHLSEGLFALVSYTLSKNLTTSYHAHEGALADPNGVTGVFSP
jgi:hypothetical protein